MSDKQRIAHAQAHYWNGPLTRAEAQKVFDETAGVIQKANETIVKLDMVLAFLVEKSGVTTEEIQTWIDARVKQMRAQMEANAQRAAEVPGTSASSVPDQVVPEQTTDPLVTLA